MNLMKKKLNKKGFTLAELLVVVAIIAVLVAISIPVFGSAMSKAEHAKDLATVRANYAEAVVAYMTSDKYTGTTAGAKVTVAAADLKKNVDTSTNVYFDAGADGAEGTITVIRGSHKGTFKTDSDVTVTGLTAAPTGG